MLGATGPTGPTGPQGLIGATGPTGPSLGLSAFGGRFNNTTQTITLGIGTQAQIPLANTMPSRGVTYTTANSINIPSATISRDLSVGTGSIYSGSVIVTLSPGDVVDMAASATLALGVTLGTGVNATISVKRLS